MNASGSFPIDRTSTKFYYTPAHLRSALLQRPALSQDGKSIHVASASYCRQNQEDAREFIIFHLKGDSSVEESTVVFLLDQDSSRNAKDRELSDSSQHSSQCLPVVRAALGFLKPNYWKSLKDPGRFYVPIEGSLDDLLESRGLKDYVEVDKIVFKDSQAYDLEHLVVWASAVSTPTEFYQKRLAQSPCWFSSILWNAMTRIAKPGAEPSADIQRIANDTLENLFGKVEIELQTFRNELAGIEEQKEAEARLERDRRRSLIAQQRELDVMSEQLGRNHDNNTETPKPGQPSEKVTGS